LSLRLFQSEELLLTILDHPITSESLLTQAIADAGSAEIGIATLANLVLSASPDDQMFDTSDPHAYLKCGASALKVISACLSLAEHSSADRILDFGCGHGRVMRWLRAAYPSAQITGTDVNESGVNFCAGAFGSIPIVSGYDFNNLPNYGENSLIWAGSVFTHLKEAASRALLNDFLSWLAPNGVAIFSSHGRSVVTRLVEYHFPYMMGGKNAPLLAGYYGPRAYGYAPYPETPEYGISLTSPTWFWDELKGRDDVRLVMYSERAWDYHHDIVAIQRVPI
jgi:SAM-dependent methyltransferase